MGVMRADDRSQPTQGGRRRVLRSHLPDEPAGSLRDDEDDGAAVVADDVLRMEALVTRVVPAVGPQARDGVQEYAVLILAPAHDGVPGCLAVTKFVEMLGRHPVPEDLAVPAHLDDARRPRQVVSSHFGPGAAPLAEDQGVTPIDQGLHSGNVVADGSPFPCEVMVLSSGP